MHRGRGAPYINKANGFGGTTNFRVALKKAKVLSTVWLQQFCRATRYGSVLEIMDQGNFCFSCYSVPGEKGSLVLAPEVTTYTAQQQVRSSFNGELCIFSSGAS